MRLLVSLFLTLMSVGLLQAEPVKVAVTNPFYAEWVKRVGGESVETVLLTEDDTSGLESAAIVYETGLGQEPWLDPAAAKMQKAPRRIVLSDGIPTMTQTEEFWAKMPLPHPNPEKMPECCRKDAADTNAAWEKLVKTVPKLKMPEKFGYDPDAIDPNIWYNPLNAQGAVLVINETLAEVSPDNADTYDRNAYAYMEELDDLDGWIKSRIRNVPMEKRILVTSGNSFRYYAKAYGLAAPLDNPEYMGLVFKEINPAKQDHPCECGGPKLYTATEVDDSAADGTYQKLMTENTATIVETWMGEETTPESDNKS